MIDILDMIKWISSVILAIGITLTAFNIYPINLYFQIAGIVGWVMVGFTCHDKPLIFINVFGLIVLIMGVIYSW
tara:strand:+ start:18409 stop:18630 length:222 start_codon:yes stop_codon:yes gene_type:complete